MFRTAELGHILSKQDYKQQVPPLRQELLEVQNELQDADFPVIVVFAGVDGAGKSETVDILHEWMDPRWLSARAFGPPSDEERDRPEYWRYWRELPPRGRIGLFLSSWYSPPFLDYAYERSSLAEFDERLDRINTFEQDLAEDGALILKFWMHLSRDAQKKRLKKLEKDPLLHWRVSKTDWKHWRMYDQFMAAAERTIMKTSTGHAPWKIIEGLDERYRSVTVATFIKEAIQHRLEAQRTKQDRVPETIPPAQTALSGGLETLENEVPMTVLSALDMDQSLKKSDYKTSLHEYQGKLNQLQQAAKENGVSTILVFEGWDAAGKGGAIRRIIHALDARDYQVMQVAAPTDEEKAHHYLWRFWRYLPRAGRITLFDRSWYGRVLVERIEGFAGTREWQRAYTEINDFEEQLTEFGIVLLKFWIHITRDEQLDRFKAREQTPYKSWKLTEEDWRNRERWDEYALAVNDMVERTSTRGSSWTLVEGNDKRYARIKVLRTLCEGMETALKS